MPDTAPRLPSTDPGTQPGYAPISWTAVAALAVSILFMVVLAAMAWGAADKKQALIQPWLLFFPALALVLAFVARRQIVAAEGTRTGLTYAAAGWWIAVVGGLGYVAYLGAIEFAVRRQAEREFTAWADKLKAIDPTNEKDPKIYEAVYMTLPPGSRGAPGDIARIELANKDDVGAFRQTDLVRLISRNRGATEFRVQGLRDWEQKPTEITASLSAVVVTPEGEHTLIIPMRAVQDEKTRDRRWQIAPSGDGYIKQRRLTEYGWMVEHLEATGRAFVQEFLVRMSSRIDTALVGYLGYVHPDWDVRTGLGHFTKILGTAPASGGLFGSASLVYLPRPAGADEFMKTRIFGRPDGAPLSSEDLSKLLFCWSTGGTITPAGAILRGNYELHPILMIGEDRVELRVPVELAIAGRPPMPSGSRGRIILRPVSGQPELDLLNALKTARTAGPGAAKLDEPTKEILNRQIPWRIVRFESDLRIHVSQQASPARGMPGDGI